jgi:hypothetical protein
VILALGGTAASKTVIEYLEELGAGVEPDPGVRIGNTVLYEIQRAASWEEAYDRAAQLVAAFRTYSDRKGRWPVNPQEVAEVFGGEPPTQGEVDFIQFEYFEEDWSFRGGELWEFSRLMRPIPNFWAGAHDPAEEIVGARLVFEGLDEEPMYRLAWKWTNLLVIGIADASVGRELHPDDWESYYFSSRESFEYALGLYRAGSFTIDQALHLFSLEPWAPHGRLTVALNDLIPGTHYALGTNWFLPMWEDPDGHGPRTDLVMDLEALGALDRFRGYVTDGEFAITTFASSGCPVTADRVFLEIRLAERESPNLVPEPAGGVLFLAGVALVLRLRRRRG